MKSEHRHELKTNELERIASDWGHASERYVQDHTNQLIVVAVVIVAIIIGAIYWRMSSGSADRQGWRALSDAQSTADYGTVADKYAATKVAPWARLREGEAELSSGIRLLFNDREAGRSDLKKAEESFEKLINDKQTPEEVRERALFGSGALPRIAAGERCRRRDDQRSGDRNLQTLARSISGIRLQGRSSKPRIAALRTGTAQDFSAWFETQNPKPADRAMPKDLSIPPLPEDFGPGQTGASKGHLGEGPEASLHAGDGEAWTAVKPAATRPEAEVAVERAGPAESGCARRRSNECPTASRPIGRS